MKTISVTFAAIVIVSLFFVTGTSSVSQQAISEYDHWLDINDDGFGGIDDIVLVAEHFGYSGSPINKTALFLELLNIVTEINMTFEIRFPQTGRVSISASAFHQVSGPDTDQFVNHFGNRFDNYQIECPTGQCDAIYVAPVQLPDGVQITNVTIYWYDNWATRTINCSLFRDRYYFPSASLLYLQSYGSAGYGWTSGVPPKDLAIVDNTYQYWFEVIMPPCIEGEGCNISFWYVEIEYQYTA